MVAGCQSDCGQSRYRILEEIEMAKSNALAPAQIRETAMANPCFAFDQEQIVDTMIALTRPSSLRGIIITGSESMDLYVALRRRGFCRVSTPVTCPAPKRQHAIGLVTGQNPVAALVQASSFLSTNSAVAVLIGDIDKVGTNGP
jgi:hypothetical protein